MPRYFDVRTTVLVVVGYGILPEEEDRPIAYEIRRAINARGEVQPTRDELRATLISNREDNSQWPRKVVI